MKLFACCVAVVFCCFSASVVVASGLAAPFVGKAVPVGIFSELDVQNPINVDIIPTHSTTPTLQILGDSRSVAAVRWAIKNSRLFLSTTWNYWPRKGDRLAVKLAILPAQLNHIRFASHGCLVGKGFTGSLALLTKGNGCVKLCTNNLNLKSLLVDGKTNITVNHLKSTDLVIQGKNDGKIKIEGEIALKTVHLSGQGSLVVYLINTAHLQINATDTQKLFLAGTVQNLEVQLSEQAHLLAKQLRVATGFVETQHRAQAEITITDKLSALAKDNSVIYYDPHVKFMSTYTEDAGLVLSH